MIAAEFRAAPGFEVVRRTTLFTSRDYIFGTPYQEYDVTRDARHFVMVRHLGGPSQLTVMLHRFEHAR
jgi:hypothetical protein